MPRKASIAVCASLLVLAVVPVGAARASEPSVARHTVLEASYPAADSVHREEVREIRLRYSTAVQPALSTITLTGPRGVLPVGAVETVSGSEERELRVSLRTALPSGSYRIEWRTAGPDNHPINGAFAFVIERPEAVVEAVPDDPAGVPGQPVLVSPGSGVPTEDNRFAPAGLVVRSLFLLSILGMTGTAVFRLAVVGPLANDPLLADGFGRAAARTRGLAWTAAILALAALPARLVKQSADFFGAAAFDWSSLETVLVTGWGGAWHLELAMAVLFLAGLLRVGGDKDRAAGWWMMLVAALGSSLVPALSGHAAGSPEPMRAFAVLSDSVHVAAAGAWLGTLGVVLLAGLGTIGAPAQAVPTSAPGEVLPPLARLVNAFSRVALIAVAVLLTTGLVNAWLRLGSLGALFASDYGRTLLVKVALAAVAAALGFYNWRVVRPSLASDPRPGLLRIPATVEASIGIVIVLLTAVLVSTPPPLP